MAIAATGLTASATNSASPNPGATERAPDRRHLRSAMRQLDVLQIDAVNAVARSHLLVLRARTHGSHDELATLLDRGAYAHGEFTEYWCHEAAYCATDDWPLYRWRMKRGEQGQMWRPLARYAAERHDEVRAVHRWLTEHGPASVAEAESALATAPRPPRKPNAWWGWSDAKRALGWLFWTGKVGVSERVAFSRRYDVIERVVPAEVVSCRIDEPEALRRLVRKAAARLGVATPADLIDYHRLPKREGAAAVRQLVEAGELVAVKVGATEAFTLTDATLARRSSRSVLLSPFDPLVWFRPRAEWLFGFHYRIEIYTPEADRRYGYYVLPFLHDDQLVARVDVRADRRGCVLRVPGAFAEPGAFANAGRGRDAPIVAALADELRRLSVWCGLGDVAVGERGDLIDALRRELGR